MPSSLRSFHGRWTHYWNKPCTTARSPLLTHEETPADWPLFPTAEWETTVPRKAKLSSWLIKRWAKVKGQEYEPLSKLTVSLRQLTPAEVEWFRQHFQRGTFSLNTPAGELPYEMPAGSSGHFAPTTAATIGRCDYEDQGPEYEELKPIALSDVIGRDNYEDQYPEYEELRLVELEVIGRDDYEDQYPEYEELKPVVLAHVAGMYHEDDAAEITAEEW